MEPKDTQIINIVTSRRKLIGAVEMGTSKVCALIAEVGPNNDLYIVGFGKCSSNGIVKGTILDVPKASEAVHTALSTAEDDANNRVKRVFLAQTGGHLEGFYNEASVRTDANSVVGSREIESVCESAKSKELPAGRVLVHYLRRPFMVDGNIRNNPRNVSGRILQVGYWIVHGDENRLKDNIRIFEDYQVLVDDLVLSSIASGCIVSTHLERQQGVLVLDIGGGVTDFVLYRHGSPYITGVLPVGGVHLTNDLSLGLHIAENRAEALKLRHGRAMIKAKNKDEQVWLIGDHSLGDKTIPQMAIEQILSARVEEIFRIVKEKLGEAYSPQMIPSGVIITGGTAKLPGIAEVAARIFEAPAKVGEAPTWVERDELRDPEYSTVLGVLRYTMNTGVDMTSHSQGKFNRLFKMFGLSR